MKLLKRTIISFLLTFILVTIPISTPSSWNTHQVEAATLKLNKSKATLYIGEKLSLKSNGSSGNVKWSSSDNKIATVSTKGVVTAVKKGTATITAVIGSQKCKCSITVKDLAISNKTLTLGIGEKGKLTIRGASGQIVWKSADTSIATVSSNGAILGSNEGTVKITAKYKNKVYTCKVTVINKMLHASNTDLTISEDTVISITSDRPEAETLDAVSKDPNIVDFEWGEFVGDTAPLKIIVKGYGTTYIVITTDLSDEKLIIKVTVTDKINLDAKELTAKEIYAKCSPATVLITTDEGLGSGFFIDKGKIITNYHVIEGAKSIKVKMKNGNEYDVDKILGYKPDLDIAILSIPVTTNDVLKLNQHGVTVGETVYAIGNPLGLTDTFTNGIVTNASRMYENVNYIQTNAAISPGNSGGPLINAYGEVMGINTMQYVDGQNLNFAIKIDQINNVSLSNPVTVAEYAGDKKASAGIPAPDPDENTDEFAEMEEDSSKSNDKNTCQTLLPETIVSGYLGNNEIDYYRIDITTETEVAILGMPHNSNVALEDFLLGVTDLQGNFYELSDYEIYKGMNIFFYSLKPGTYYIAVITNPDAKYTETDYTLSYIVK